MDEELDILVTGFEVSDRLAEAGLTRVFGLDAQRAKRFMREVPLVAKRCSSAVVADRYVAALRSIGARVELRAAGEAPDDATRRTLSSLPIPAPSMLAQVHESVRVERETARAIARFRANEGLDGSTPAADVDPVNPHIPKAPLVPHDLHRMPNARLPQFSDRPDWMLNDPLGGPGMSDESFPHMDADPPPRPSTAPSAVAKSSRPPPASAAPPSSAKEGESLPPSRSVGLAHAATASVRPGLGLLASWDPTAKAKKQAERPRRPLPWRWIGAGFLAVALLGTVAFVLLDTDESRRARGWRAEGVDAGEYAPVAWLELPGHELRGASKDQVRELVASLSREGAQSIYAVRIQATDTGELASALLIELPTEREARRMILWLAAKSSGLSPPLIPDRGQRIHVLEFPK